MRPARPCPEYPRLPNPEIYLKFRTALCQGRGLFYTDLVTAVSGEAIPAINRTIATGTERYFGFYATCGTGSGVHFSLRAGAATKTAVISLLAGCSALRATSGFVGETLFSVKFLLGSRESEVGPAIAAGQSFVLIHGNPPHNRFAQNGLGDSLIFTSLTIKKQMRRINELDLTRP